MRKLLLGLLMVCLWACGSPQAAATPTPVARSGPIAISDVWIRATAFGEPASTPGEHNSLEPGWSSAVYLQIDNSGDTPDQLLRASTDIARLVELHQSINQNGTGQMRYVEGIEIPAHSQLTLRSGGFHLMLVDLKRDLHRGETVQITLEFAQAGTISIPAEVR